MAQRPAFNMSRLTNADKILLIGTLVYFIDTFLPWQRVCISFATVHACGGASAWGGSAGFLGILSALFALALLAWTGMQLGGVNLNVGMPAIRISQILVLGMVAFGLLKFIIVLTNHPGYGAFIGVVLLIVIGYGAYMKMQEAGAGPIAPPGPAAPPPPPVG
jgi:protein-S-isoprenylcysteine O-methyltransferase Ste14